MTCLGPGRQLEAASGRKDRATAPAPAIRLIDRPAAAAPSSGVPSSLSNQAQDLDSDLDLDLDLDLALDTIEQQVNNTDSLPPEEAAGGLASSSSSSSSSSGGGGGSSGGGFGSGGAVDVVDLT